MTQIGKNNLLPVTKLLLSNTTMASGYSCNDNQNYFVSEGRTTSRVLQMPGGKSSFTLFGSAPEVSRTPSKKSKWFSMRERLSEKFLPCGKYSAIKILTSCSISSTLCESIL